MAQAVHTILGGNVQLFRRPNSSRWQCRASVGGKQLQHSTKQSSLAAAKDVAEDWYLTLKGKVARGEKIAGKSFEDVATHFIDEFEVLTLGQRSPQYVSNHRGRITKHLIPFFGNKRITEVNAGLIQQYRIHRMRQPGPNGQPPARTTLHQEMVCLRQILKTANRHGWIEYMPDMSSPYKASGKVSHRAWFSPDEYKRLFKATGERAKNPKKERWRNACEDLHDYVLFMVNSGLRPDEALRIEKRDIEVVQDGANNERILHIAVRGKRGVGYCKTMPGAVLPFQRMVKRHSLGPSNLVFPNIQRQLFNAILNELDMKKDREGNARTTYSLRHTYICFRLMEGADIYQIAKNCRTSVEMIEKYYAAHIKNMLDATAINVRKPKPARKARPKSEE
ncbi:tyrosine-type recombinase/integrase [Sphingopyxis sp. GC21]|uniref:tyrosine-type recombinase/integrase n=1 Tax=Sphingopyxis sp. GC21 TaxID=2933562 RepID=UPI0021E42D56|nr:site-specific integrase [Sphingopyxis sp. GC21]